MKSIFQLVVLVYCWRTRPRSFAWHWERGQGLSSVLGKPFTGLMEIGPYGVQWRYRPGLARLTDYPVVSAEFHKKVWLLGDNTIFYPHGVYYVN